MRNFTTVMACLACMLIMNISYGQDVKVGYTNAELLLAYMPEAKSMEQSLQSFQKKLAEKLKAKDDYMKGKYTEYLKLKESGGLSGEEGKRRENELMQLDSEVKKFAQESEQQLMIKRQELLEPILNKLQNAIDKVAEENGFTYIMNQTTSAGVSTILYGPEEHDMTEKIMKELGIQIPSGN
ncbi:OmpH family outer membrane protein [Aureitalea sp. L0-47]|uniref:OmpH family outer membrane protein n=1 Tax=Aureitalea sp. L0-47 TaxID=2816962 RepID=UPI002237FC30|nr:OmpH family outer membrane protein [Aureitalea sp. L0-47]MCW5519417.1 OmpH family outer membrane protein [Aureitalea sp. L0-47]